MNNDPNTNNRGFFDLSPEERAYWYDKVEAETGRDFHDLPPEERGRYYDRATKCGEFSNGL